MKAITLTQPCASLVAIGAKKIETRSWRTNYRGPLAIHAAKSFPGDAKHFCESLAVCRAFGWPECPKPLTQNWLDDNAARIAALPRGCVIATCELLGDLTTWDIRSHAPYSHPFTQQEAAFGDYGRDRFGWLLADVKALPEPIPAKGALGLWEWEEEQL